MTAIKGARAAITAAMSTAVLALCCVPPAGAAPSDEPSPPPPPPTTGLIPPLASIGTVLGQTDSAPAGPLGMPDLAAYAPGLLLAQSPDPSVPGQPGPLALPELSAFNPEFLVGQNLAPAAPGEGQPAPGIGPDADDTGTGRVAFLRRIHQMYEAGLLRGALLGQVPPGTVPEPADND